MSSIASKTYESAPLKKVAFLGLGVMGYPMAGHLARAGQDMDGLAGSNFSRRDHFQINTGKA